MRRCLTLLQGFLIVTLVFSLSIPAYAAPSMGLSHFQVDIIITEGVSETFPVGVVHNEGDVSLNLSLFWVQTYGNGVLPVVVHPSSKILKPGRVCEVSVEIQESAELGYYNGSVEIEPLHMQSSDGSPIVPTGSFNIEVTIVPSVEPIEPIENVTEVEPTINETEESELEPTSEIPRWKYVLSAIVITTALICLVVMYLKWGRKRKKK